jgi:GntR family transcriptional repressor for pyruvate dehydrogenase complex
VERIRAKGGSEVREKHRVLPREVARQVEGWVRARRFSTGSKLPGERELAIRLGTSRAVLREALKILETRGVVEVRHGVGTFVTEQALKRHVAMPTELRLGTSQLSIEETLVARRAIECAVVQIAARMRDEFDLEELREMLRATAKAVELRDKEAYVRADLGFHELLGQSTHNPLLRDVQTEITRATAAVRWIATDTHDAMRSTLRFHREIADELARGDGEAASAAMLLHLVDATERGLGTAFDETRIDRGTPRPETPLDH